MDNKERFIEIFTSQIHRPGAAELLEWLESTDFFEAPASTHYHGSYPGGLVEHSLNVYYELIGAGRVPGVPTAETYWAQKLSEAEAEEKSGGRNRLYHFVARDV